MKGWLTVKQAVEYCGVRERTIRGWFKHGLRHCRISREQIIIRKEWLDEFLEQFEVNMPGPKKKDKDIVNEILSKVA